MKGRDDVRCQGDSQRELMHVACDHITKQGEIFCSRGKQDKDREMKS